MVSISKSELLILGQVSQFHGVNKVEKGFALKIFMVAALLLIAAWSFNYVGGAKFNLSTQQSQHKNHALIKAGDTCVSISERASAHLVPKLEFQRLELAARKANVVVRCMADHHFYQNPVWLKYSETIAVKNSSELHISVDEALEQLKRADMLVFEPVTNKPLYWQYVNNKTKPINN